MDLFESHENHTISHCLPFTLNLVVLVFYASGQLSVVFIRIKGHFGFKKQDPVVQSIVRLTISLRHKFVKQISAKVTNTLLFFVEKM